MKHRVALILHNIRSSHNVGSIFRTADGAGVSEIWLTGYTPLPVDRHERANKEISKTALGAEKYVEWHHVRSPQAAIKKLKERGYGILALEQNKKAKTYDGYKAKTDVALILGSEVKGISNALLDRADHILEIPMRGKKESLNVSVAAGIALYKLTR